MRITSRDRTLDLLIASPLGFMVTVDGHAWLFDRDSRVQTSVPPDPPVRHKAAHTPERCPGCAGFVLRDLPRKDGAV